MKSSNIIAISGLKNSGKDTASKMVQYLLNAPKFLHHYWIYKRFYKFFNKAPYKITSFALPLKKTLAALLDIPVEKFDDRNFKENYYIYFPTLEITNKLPNDANILSDSKFSKLVSVKDFSFIQTSWITFRQLLQVFGTECMRGTFGDRLWILLTVKNNAQLVISDLRFKVECEAVHSCGGKVLYIHRKSCKPGNHASEKELIELYNNNQFDKIIYNNGTFNELFDSLKTAIQEI